METMTASEKPLQVAVERRDDGFYWSEEGEPHLQRRKAMLKSHPEIKKLFGVNPWLKVSVSLLVIIQLATAFFFEDIINSVGWIPALLVAYFVGATITQALFLAIHEITHNFAFKKPQHNNWLAFFANIPIVFPFAIAFKHYHAEHHWKQGKDGFDTDIPTHAEAKIFRGFIGKVLWFVNQIFFYAFRPMLVLPMKVDKWIVYNVIFQVAAMAIILPIVGWYGLLYFLLAMLMAGGIHPTAGHFISEHYVFTPGQETYSYYGPLNLVTYNVGYHNEHHDFPNIPGSRLPMVRKLAPEYYDHLKSYNSWSGVIFKFLFSPDVTLYSRTKRK